MDRMYWPICGWRAIRFTGRLVRGASTTKARSFPSPRTAFRSSPSIILPVRRMAARRRREYSWWIIFCMAPRLPEPFVAATAPFLARLKTNGANFTLLHTFTGGDGSSPFTDLVRGDNVLYGTTLIGGVSNLGTIFSIQTNGSDFTLLHSFSNTDGTLPRGGLVLSGGVLYGTAYSGGEYGIGTVFSVKTNGTGFTVLRSFCPLRGRGQH